MKKNITRNFHVPVTNTHLMDLLEKPYYIELGNISIPVIDNLLKYKPLLLNDLFDEKITSSGIGNICKTDDDIELQLNYLLKLSSSSSSKKLVLTCGTVRYTNSLNVEKYAPIILIPIIIDFTSGTVVLSCDAFISPVLTKKAMKISSFSDEKMKEVQAEINGLKNKKIASVYDIDIICEKISKFLNVSISTTSYLTLMDVEYSEFDYKKNYFSINRSIHESTETEIIKNYFEIFSPIFPANIQQKHILLAAARKQNLIVDGRLGSGKTYTALNLMAHNIYNGKKVLYVNDDIETVKYVEKSFKQLSLDSYVLSLSRKLNDFAPVEIEEDNTVSTKSVQDIVDEINECNDFYEKRYYGCKYRQMIDKLAVLKHKGIEPIMKIESVLYNQEINKVYKKLKQIEKEFLTVDPYPANIWSMLLSSNKAPTVSDVKTRTKEFRNSTRETVDLLNQISSRYHLKTIKSPKDFSNLNEELINFEQVFPNISWLDKDVNLEAKKSLTIITDDSDCVLNSQDYYKEHTINNYKPGTIEKLIKEVNSFNYKIKDRTSDDIYYLNRLLINDNRFESLNNSIIKLVKDTSINHKYIKNLLELKTTTNVHYIFFHKVISAYEEGVLYNSWIKEYINLTPICENKCEALEKYLSQYNEKMSRLQTYLVDQKLDFRSVVNLRSKKTLFKKFTRFLNMRKLRKAHIGIHDLQALISDIYDTGKTIMQIIPHDSSYEIEDDKIWPKYLRYLQFINECNSLDKKITKTTLVKLADTKKLSLDVFVQSLVKQSSCEVLLNQIINELEYFKIELSGLTFIEKVDSLETLLPKFKLSVDTKKTIYHFFKEQQAIGYDDLILLKNVDDVYLESTNRFEKNKKRYIELFGKSYKQIDTDVALIGQSMDRFAQFAKRAKKKEDMKEIFNSLQSLVDKITTLTKSYDSWITTLRYFSGCFYRGKLDYSIKPFDELIDLSDLYVSKLDQVDGVSFIEHALDGFFKFKLDDLPTGIKNGIYKKNIADIFLCSIYTKYYNELKENNQVTYTVDKLKDTINDFDTFERAFCVESLKTLQHRAKDDSNILHRLENISINDYDEIVNRTIYDKNIYLADLSIVNSGINLSNFDLVIFDDAHLGSADKYIKLSSGAQTIVFGDRTFSSSISNTLMQRLDERLIFTLHKRYIDSTNNLNNICQLTNNYIYNPFLEINRFTYKSQKAFATLVISKFKKEKSKINIICTTEEEMLSIYKTISQVLRDDYTVEEVKNILNDNIRFTNALHDNMFLCDEVFLNYDNIRLYDDITKSIIIRNYAIATKKINICFQESRISSENTKRLDEIGKFVCLPIAIEPYGDDIAAILNQDLVNDGYETLKGFTSFDILIKHNDKLTAVMIVGKQIENNYSFIDEYLFNYNEYKKRGWNVVILTTDELYQNYDSAKHTIIKGIKDHGN